MDCYIKLQKKVVDSFCLRSICDFLVFGVWIGMVGYGWVWMDMGMFGYGWVWLGMVGSGCVWLGLVGSG